MQDTPHSQAQADNLTHAQENALTTFQDGLRSILSQKVNSTKTQWTELDHTATYVLQLELERSSKAGHWMRVAMLAAVLDARNNKAYMASKPLYPDNTPAPELFNGRFSTTV